MPEFLAVRRDANADAFARRTRDWLLEREAEHNVLLGLLPRLITGEHEYDHPIYLASIETDGQVAGCAFRTPPYKLGVTRYPRGGEDLLAADVAEVYDSLPAVLGREEDAVRFARAWADQTGASWTVGMRQRIYQLTALKEPARLASGSDRRANAGERPVLVDWLAAFARESGISGPDPGIQAEVLMRNGDLWVWDDDGPVAMAASAGHTPNGTRVGYVYTPPDLRGHGYATALVAALSKRLLDEGRRYCMLYTNVENPISNGIYARLGYRPVVDVVDVDFTSA